MMRTLFRGLTVAGVLLGPVAGAAEPGPAPNTLPVYAARAMDTDEFNRRVAEGIRLGYDMPDNPFEVAESFAGPLEAPFVSVVVLYPSLEVRPEEAPTEAVVTIVRDGYFDDSTRGDWHRLRIRRHEDGGWRLEEVLVAYRCYRGLKTQLHGFTGEFCP